MGNTGGGLTMADHACAAPVSDEQLWEIWAQFIAEGLERNERVMLFDDGVGDAVLDRLADDRVSVLPSLNSGQLIIASVNTTRALLSGPAEAVQQMVSAKIDETLALGFPRLRITCQADFALRQVGGVGRLDYDMAIGKAIQGRPCTSLCVYDHRRYPEAMIDEMRTLHDREVTSPSVYDDTLLRITRTRPTGVRLAGQADHSNRLMIERLPQSILDEALRSHSAPRQITVDLSSLRFLDVGGAVALVHAAEEFPSTHRLVLTGVRPRVQRVLDQCGAPFAAQLDIFARCDPDDAASRIAS